VAENAEIQRARLSMSAQVPTPQIMLPF